MAGPLGFLQGLNAQAGQNTALQSEADQRAFLLKLQSAKIKQEAEAEQKKFERENYVSPDSLGALKAFSQKYNLGWSPSGEKMTIADYKNVSDLLGHLANLKALSIPVAQTEVRDPKTNILLAKQDVNQLGIPVGQQRVVPGGNENATLASKMYDLHDAMTNLWNKYVEGGYNTGGAGTAMEGSVLSKLGPLAPKTNELARAQESLKALTLQVRDQIPGGRAAMAGANMANAYQLGPGVHPDVGRNILDNFQYGIYKNLASMGARVPDDLGAKFSNIPLDSAGRPVDGVFSGGQFKPAAQVLKGTGQPGNAEGILSNNGTTQDPYAGMTLAQKLSLASQHHEAFNQAKQKNQEELQKQVKQANGK